MSKYPNQYFNNKLCKKCGTEYTPTAPSHLYCSTECAEYGYRDSYLKRTYNISTEKYDELFSKQEGLCKICEGEGFLMADCHKFRLVVDHCHKTGRIRGLLCHNCNRALGLFQDCPEIAQRGVEYLKEGSETIWKQSTPK